jgi:hypothetical protein
MARIRIIQNCAFLPICLAIIIGCCVPFLLFEGIDPPFPDIDYISEEDYVPGVPAAEKSRLDLANEKFDLCCRQAGLCFRKWGK